MAPPDEGGAWVSASEIYAELRRVGDAVVRLEERLAHDDTSEEVDRIKERVTALEQRVWRASGVAATLGGLVGVVVPFLTK
ncbi:hypothetical protein [Streptomyces lydicus]|uniref:hypothetical protein n=1 Tax=Streptomyces lydicus TaxID=47763 RepID=UPI0036E8483C